MGFFLNPINLNSFKKLYLFSTEIYHRFPRRVTYLHPTQQLYHPTLFIPDKRTFLLPTLLRLITRGLLPQHPTYLCLDFLRNRLNFRRRDKVFSLCVWFFWRLLLILEGDWFYWDLGFAIEEIDEEKNEED